MSNGEDSYDSSFFSESPSESSIRCEKKKKKTKGKEIADESIDYPRFDFYNPPNSRISSMPSSSKDPKIEIHDSKNFIVEDASSISSSISANSTSSSGILIRPNLDDDPSGESAYNSALEDDSDYDDTEIINNAGFIEKLNIIFRENNYTSHRKPFRPITNVRDKNWIEIEFTLSPIKREQVLISNRYGHRLNKNYINNYLHHRSYHEYIKAHSYVTKPYLIVANKFDNDNFLFYYSRNTYFMEHPNYKLNFFLILMMRLLSVTHYDILECWHLDLSETQCSEHEIFLNWPLQKNSKCIIKYISKDSQKQRLTNIFELAHNYLNDTDLNIDGGNRQIYEIYKDFLSIFRDFKNSFLLETNYFLNDKYVLHTHCNVKWLDTPWLEDNSALFRLVYQKYKRYYLLDKDIIPIVNRIDNSFYDSIIGTKDSASWQNLKNLRPPTHHSVLISSRLNHYYYVIIILIEYWFSLLANKFPISIPYFRANSTTQRSTISFTPVSSTLPGNRENEELKFRKGYTRQFNISGFYVIYLYRGPEPLKLVLQEIRDYLETKQIVVTIDPVMDLNNIYTIASHRLDLAIIIMIVKLICLIKHKFGDDSLRLPSSRFVSPSPTKVLLSTYYSVINGTDICYNLEYDLAYIIFNYHTLSQLIVHSTSTKLNCINKRRFQKFFHNRRLDWKNAWLFVQLLNDCPTVALYLRKGSYTYEYNNFKHLDVEEIIVWFLNCYYHKIAMSDNEIKRQLKSIINVGQHM